MTNYVKWKSQPQNATYYMIPFILNSQNREMYRDRKEISDHLEPGGGKIIAKGIEFLRELMKMHN